MDWAEIADGAVEAIQEAGQSATMRRQFEAQYDPATATVTPLFADYACTLVDVAYSANDIDGTLIRASDRRLLVAPDIDQAPQSGDVFTLSDGALLTAINVKTTAPAGVPVLFEVQARGGMAGVALKPWILAEGAWSDAGQWQDDAFWMDGDQPAWLLTSGIWNDSGAWNDAATWRG
jgi:hypothetical protein